jgi:uncharacterized cupredoxin-like copper-binding protein
MRKVLVLMALSAVVFASCAKESKPEALKPASLTVKASDYKYSAPKTAKSGEVRITLINRGKEPHQAQLFKMKKTVDLGDLVKEGKKPEPERRLTKFGEYVGGPNAVDPGETEVAIDQLGAGRYAFFCQVPDAHGHAHLALGMVSQLEVTQADEEAEAPSADYSSSAKEYKYKLPGEWDGTIAFENRGKQPHELQVIGVAEGKKPEDVEAWFKAKPGTAGPPTWTTDGGISVLQPGETGSFEGNLDPGTYFAMCFVPDEEKDGAPHFALGMMQRFEVKGEVGLSPTRQPYERYEVLGNRALELVVDQLGDGSH